MLWASNPRGSSAHAKVAWAVGGVLAAGFLATLLVASLRFAHAISKSTGLKLREESPDVDADPWPTFRGPQETQFGTSRVTVPRNLSAALRWSWHHPKGRFATLIAGGPIIDAVGNLYLSTNDGIRKLSPTGKVLWHHRVPDNKLNNAPGLWDGMVFCSDMNGVAFALDQRNGKNVWRRKLAIHNGGDCGYPAAYNGVFVVAANTTKNGGNSDVYGLHASSGRTLWHFRPLAPVWNFAPLFARRGAVAFMDLKGGMYSLGLHDGVLRWYTPVPLARHSFSDGGAVLGPLGDVFSCSNPGTGLGKEGTLGLLRRLRLSDGAVMWEQRLPQPCNSYPAVGRLGPGRKELSVVVTPGSFMESPKLHGSIMAFDVLSGRPRWRFNLQAYTGVRNWAKGDAEGFETRHRLDPGHEICLPAHWSSANIDGEGFAYAGRCDGYVYGVRATRRTQPPAESGDELAFLGADFPSSPGLEVRKWNANAAPLHGAFGFAPGTVAFATCDTLYVFKA